MNPTDPAPGFFRWDPGVIELPWRDLIRLVVWPLLFGLVASVFIVISGLDMELATRAWEAGNGTWLGKTHPATMALYHYGTWPALALAISGLTLAVVGWFQGHRRAAMIGLFFALSLVIGPGLVVNAVFKDHFGRPRPIQVTEFGGPLKTLPLGQPGIAGKGKSFPSGHASMGFFLGLPAFLFLRRHRGWCVGFFVFGVVAGGLMGVARILQGAHWLSDILWSGLFVHLTAVGCALALGLVRVARPSVPQWTALWKPGTNPRRTYT